MHLQILMREERAEMQAKILLNLLLLLWGLFAVFVIINCTIFIISGKLPFFKGGTTHAVITPSRKKLIRILGTILCIVGIVSSANVINECVRDIPYVTAGNALEVKGIATYVDNANFHIGINDAKIEDMVTGESVRILLLEVGVWAGDYIEAIYYPNTKLSIITGHTSKAN